MNTITKINNRIIIENNEMKMLPFNTHLSTNPCSCHTKKNVHGCSHGYSKYNPKYDCLSDSDSLSDYENYDLGSDFGSELDYGSGYSDRSNSPTDFNSDSSSVSSDENSCFRRPNRKKRNRLNLIESIYYDYQSNTSNPLGYTTEITKENPIIADLINRRISNCRVGPSSHIAAFLSSSIDIRSCFISGYRKKGRCR